MNTITICRIITITVSLENKYQTTEMKGLARESVHAAAHN